MIVQRTDRGIEITRRMAAALIFLVFDAAFILTPYWRTVPDVRLAWVAFLLSIAVGIGWALNAGAACRIRIERSDAAALALLAAGCLAIDQRALTTDIPWRGDEDFHIMATAPLALRLKPYLAIAAVACAAYLAINRFAAKRAISVASMAALALLAIPAEPLFQYSTFAPLRYPFLTRYISALPVVASTYFVEQPSEITYRLLPFVCAVLTAFLFGRKVTQDRRAALLAGTFVFTVPLLLYYSSILYLELPAVLLMTIVAFDAEHLLNGDLPDAMNRPSWLALIAIGFVKETTVPFLAAFLVCRLVVRVTRRWHGAHTAHAADEIRVLFAVAAPLTLYLAYRAVVDGRRPLPFEIDNLREYETFRIFGWSYLEQLGPLLIAAAAGAVLLLVERRYTVLLFLSCAYLFDAALHVLDYSYFAGYSRFNLFVLPAALAASATAFARLRERSATLMGAALVCGLVVNVALSPVNRDGSKRPRWGSYVSDTAEHYYPYKRAREWIVRNGLVDGRILFTGMSYPYYALTVLEPFPHQEEITTDPSPDETQAIREALERAQRTGYDVVVYHVLSEHAPNIPPTAGFEAGHVIANEAHQLIVFRRVTPRTTR